MVWRQFQDKRALTWRILHQPFSLSLISRSDCLANKQTWCFTFFHVERQNLTAIIWTGKAISNVRHSSLGSRWQTVTVLRGAMAVSWGTLVGLCSNSPTRAQRKTKGQLIELTCCHSPWNHPTGWIYFIHISNPTFSQACWCKRKSGNEAWANREPSLDDGITKSKWNSKIRKWNCKSTQNSKMEICINYCVVARVKHVSHTSWNTLSFVQTPSPAKNSRWCNCRPLWWAMRLCSSALPFWTRLLQRARMDYNGYCASECRKCMSASYSSNCEMPKSSSNFQRNRAIPPELCNECPPYKTSLQTFAKKPSIIFYKLQPTITIQLIEPQ